MPLQPATEPTIFTDPGTSSVIFGMNNLLVDQSVKVMVHPDAIQQLGGIGNPIEVVRTHLPSLERIASTKFDKQGGGTEVTLKEADLI